MMPKNVERFPDDICSTSLISVSRSMPAAQAARVTEAHEISSGP
jgi:hypothetical protein